MCEECFPVWEYIDDEMKARGWDKFDLATAMGGDVDVNYLTLELIQYVTAAHPESLIGDETAQGLATAFGTSADIWNNLSSSYAECRKRRASIEAN